MKEGGKDTNIIIPDDVISQKYVVAFLSFWENLTLSLLGIDSKYLENGVGLRWRKKATY